jgi:toxin ParE1/3/4
MNRLLMGIDRKIQFLREFPDIGRYRDDLRPGARILIDGVYLILCDYHADDDLVEIVSVVDGRRDLKTLSLFSE